MAVMESTRLHNRLWRILLLPLCVFALSGMVKPSPSTAETHVALPGESCRVPPLDAWKDRPEEWVWSQVCEGKKADFNARYGVKLDPKSPDGWDENRALSSTFLETILLHEPFRSALTRNGVHIVGAWFKEPVDLADAKLEHQLRLEVSRFESSVSLERLRNAGPISLDGSTFSDSLNMGSMELGGDLNLRRTTAFDEVYLRNAEIAGEINLYGSKFTGGLNMDSMRVGKHLNMYESKFTEVILNSAEIGGLIDLQSSTFASALQMDKLHVGSSLFMRGGAKFGEVILSGAKIDSQLFMDRSAFTGTLVMDSMEVGGNLFMRWGAEFGEVVLRGAKIGGQLDMIGSAFTGTLNMDSMEVGGDLFMRGGAEFDEVVLRGAKIGDQLSMIGSTFTGTLDMDSMEVGSSLFMRGGAEFDNVDLRSAKIGGQLDMTGSKFTGELNMDKLQVGTSLFMSDGAEFNEVDLRSAKIGGVLSMIGSKFTGKLNMDSMVVGGKLFMRGGEFAKPLPLIFSKIGSNLDLSGAKLAGLDLAGTQISGELRVGSGNGSVEWGDASQLTLRNAMVGALQYRQDAWPKFVELEGFTYDRLRRVGPAAVSEIQWFIDWLADDESYTPQPYEQLASVLRKAGQYDKANDILFAGKERERAGATGFKRVGLSVLMYSIGYGYGYRYFYSLIWIGALVVIGVLVLRVTGESQRLRMPYGIAYSLDMLLPIVRLREWHYDKVDLKPPARYYFYFHKLMGYVLASFLIAGLSGLTK